MIKYCAWHKLYFGFVKYLGEKEPFDDPSETAGCCPDCARIVNAEIEQDKADNRPIDKCWTVTK